MKLAARVYATALLKKQKVCRTFLENPEIMQCISPHTLHYKPGLISCKVTGDITYCRRNRGTRLGQPVRCYPIVSFSFRNFKKLILVV